MINCKKLINGGTARRIRVSNFDIECTGERHVYKLEAEIEAFIASFAFLTDIVDTDRNCWQ